MTSTAQLAYDYIKANPGATVTEIAAGIDRKRVTLEGVLRRWSRNGTLRREKRDRNGFPLASLWYVVEGAARPTDPSGGPKARPVSGRGKARLAQIAPRTFEDERSRRIQAVLGRHKGMARDTAIMVVDAALTARHIAREMR